MLHNPICRDRASPEGKRRNFKQVNWCEQHGVDGKKGECFNPVEDVPKPKLTKYKKAQTLSAAEVRELLAAIQRDESTLGKRDYAFFLARLLVGVHLKSLLELRRGQIRVENEKVRILWGRGKARRERLPEAVWEAIQDYLEACGRLEGMVRLPVGTELGVSAIKGSDGLYLDTQDTGHRTQPSVSVLLFEYQPSE